MLLKKRLLDLCFLVNFLNSLEQFFIEHLRTATPVLYKNLKHFTINYDLAKYLKPLTIVIDF